ncbi:MAG: hypothetical protein J6K58_06230 [Lachnospiraceae bacterium]|nr:hypothetical protein [Lachnospiraceae bacterium]
MVKIAPITAIFAIFEILKIKEVIIKSNSSWHKLEIKTAIEQLKDLPAINTGETNHVTNTKCCNIYSNITSLLESYLMQERDGERVRKIADGLEMAD